MLDISDAKRLALATRSERGGVAIGKDFYVVASGRPDEDYVWDERRKRGDSSNVCWR
jgi:hypothetical protein